MLLLLVRVLLLLLLLLVMLLLLLLFHHLGEQVGDGLFLLLDGRQDAGRVGIAVVGGDGGRSPLGGGGPHGGIGGRAPTGRRVALVLGPEPFALLL